MTFDLVKFNSQTYTVMTETTAQQIELFNAASNGAITLTSSRNVGDFANSAFFKSIAGLVRRRNVDSDAAIASARLTQGELTSVKVAAGTPQILWEPNEYLWIQQNPALAAVKIGEQLAVANVEDMVNTAILALVAAFSGADIVHDASDAKSNIRVFNSGAAKFGDRAQSIVAWLMHSTVAHDIYDSALANANSLFNFGTVNIREDGFGRRFLVSDSPALQTAGVDPAPDTFATLGLVKSAVTVEENGDFTAVSHPITGFENPRQAYQASWSFNLGIKGYTWDKANGGASPNNTALGTAANWDRVAADRKNTAGVKVISQ